MRLEMRRAGGEESGKKLDRRKRGVAAHDPPGKQTTSSIYRRTSRELDMTWTEKEKSRDTDRRTGGMTEMVGGAASGGQSHGFARQQVTICHLMMSCCVPVGLLGCFKTLDFCPAGTDTALSTEPRRHCGTRLSGWLATQS